MALTASGTVSGYPKNPNATGLTRLTTGLSADDAKYLLKGQVVVASYNSGGTRLDATRAQIQSVLDALYAASAKTQTLGVTYSGNVPSVKLWAPTAKSVTLRRYATSTGAEAGNVAMTLDAASGVWSAAGDAAWNRQFYLFDVQVYVPSVDAVVNNLVTDPYAVNLSADTTATSDLRSQFVNLADADLKPNRMGQPGQARAGRAGGHRHLRDAHPRLQHQRQHGGRRRPRHLQGVHLRRHGAARQHDAVGRHEPSQAVAARRPDPHPPAAGLRHRLGDRAGGPAHRADDHLQPGRPIAHLARPAGGGRRSRAPPTASTGATIPYHYGVPEGSYSTNPDGVTRILEFRDMVSALNRNGLRVVMDVVYNHTAASGQDDKSVLDKVVPGYYYRYNTNGDALHHLVLLGHRVRVRDVREADDRHAHPLGGGLQGGRLPLRPDELPHAARTWRTSRPRSRR